MAHFKKHCNFFSLGWRYSPFDLSRGPGRIPRHCPVCSFPEFYPVRFELAYFQVALGQGGLG